MPALDKQHQIVRNCLIKDGWTITHDPYKIKFGGEKVYVDLGAERELIGAEKGKQKIAIEIKSFRGPSPIADLEQAVGQFGVYETLLMKVEPTRQLYLAVPESAYKGVFQNAIGALILSERIQYLLRFDPEKEEVVGWIP